LFENNSRSDDTVLRSENYLNADYVPEEPVGREAEIERIADAVRPVSHRKQGDNLLIYGPAGVGKTTCVRYVLNQLDDNTRVKPVYINCWQYNTRSSLLTEILIQLGYPAPRKGKPIDELLSKAREWVDRNRGVIITLDEFDQLDEKTETVYDIQLLNEEAENAAGLLMISNQQPSALQLDPRSQSRLNCQTLQFKPYTTPQLVEILGKRVEQAFRPGTVPDEVIESIAEQVAKENGDCRKALKTLLRAGRKAYQEGQSELTSETVDSIL